MPDLAIRSVAAPAGAAAEKDVLQKLDQKVRAELAVCANYVLEVEGTPSAERTAEYYMRKAFADNTYRSYRASLKDFVAWTGLDVPVPVTSTTVVQYLVDRANQAGARVKKKPDPGQGEDTKVAPTTLAHRAAAISFVHRLLGHADPTDSAAVSAVLKGIRKTRIQEDGWEPDQAPAFNLEQVRAMVAEMGTSLHDLRDRAFILAALFGGFRQSELSALTVKHLHWRPQGVAVAMGIVKQDQEASERRYKALPWVPRAPQLCPATALHAYLEATGIEAGPVFRGIDRYLNVSDQGISKDTANRIVRKWARKANLSNADEYSVHSFRTTFVTVLRGMGIPDARISRQTDHRNLATMQIYDRPESVFADSPALVLAEALAG